MWFVKSMGSTSSTNRAKNAIEGSISVSSDSLQTAESGCSLEAVQSLEGCTDLRDVHFREALRCDVKSTQQASTSIAASAGTQIGSRLDQQARTLAQNLNLNPGSISANNVAEQFVSAKTAISASLREECRQDLSGIAAQTCKDSSGLESIVMDIDLVLQGFQRCLQSNQAVLEAEQRLAAAISQTAEARQEDALTKGLLLLVVALGIVALMVVSAELTGLALLVRLLEWGAVFLAIYVGVCLAWSATHPKGHDGCGDCAALQQGPCEAAAPYCRWTGSACECDTTGGVDCSRQCSRQTDQAACLEAHCLWDGGACAAGDACRCSSQSAGCASRSWLQTCLWPWG